MNDAVIIICSTPHSKRLPRKCFMRIGGKMVLEHILDRIKPLGIQTVIAIPERKKMEERDYQEYQNIAANYHIRLFKGNDTSPLHRMADAVYWLGMDNPYAASRPQKYVIRITHDDILIDVDTVDLLLSYVKHQNAGYGITPGIVEGAGVEVIATENLLAAARDYEGRAIEDVSYFVKGEGLPNPEIVKMPARYSIEKPYRLTLDHYEDYVVLENIFRQRGIDASVDDICKYLDEFPSLLNYNRLPDVTIYTCVRNGSRWLRPAIESARGCLADYIVVDDCSDDSTLHQILEFYGNDRIEIIINERNIGLASSSNIAVNRARGKYVMRIDADDILLPGALEKMRALMEVTGADICYANYKEMGEYTTIKRENVSAKDHHHIGCALVNRRFLNEMRFKEGIRYWDGLELYNRIKDKAKIVYMDEPLWLYRVHKDSLSHSNLKEREACKPK